MTKNQQLNFQTPAPEILRGRRLQRDMAFSDAQLLLNGVATVGNKGHH